MKKFFIVTLVFVTLCAAAIAQDLDSTSVTDQFDSGTRGNASGSLTYGAPATDGSEYEDITDTDGVTGTIRYINGFAGASSGDPTHGESPVVDVTAAHTNPDRDLTDSIAAIPSNSRPGATSPDYAVLVADDGGWNGLFFGESDDSNYYIEIDAYCYDESSLGTTVYESIMVSARAARNEDENMTDFSFNLDRAGSYGLLYDSVLKTVQALKWGYGHTYTQIQERDDTIYTEYAVVSDVSEGWHTFRIECFQNFINFYFDGEEIAAVVDSAYANGRPGFGYREYGVDAADEKQGHFDNLKAGPFEMEILSAETWVVYE